MTQNEFVSECASRFIDPALALENDDVCAALAANDNAEVKRLLDEEF